MTFEIAIDRCPYCGGSLTTQYINDKRRLVCAKCGKTIYLNPVPVVASVVIKDNSILLAKRKNLPNIGKWNLPAGFLELYEQPEEGALRELKEETGLLGEDPKLCCAITQNSKRYGSVVVLGFIIPKTHGKIVPGDDASDARFFKLNDIPKIPFSSHRKIIKHAIKDLKLDIKLPFNS